MAIQPIGSPSEFLGKTQGPSSAGGPRFVDELTRMLQEANQNQVDAAKAIEKLAVDGEGSIHDAMIAMGTAEGSFRLLMTMRNKLVEATRQLLRGQA